MSTNSFEPDPQVEEGKKYIHRNRFRIVTRREWEAAAPVRTQPLASPATELVVMSETGSDWCFTQDECCTVMRRLQKQHMGEGFDDIKYNFLIGTDDRAYEGTGWETVGSKVEGHEVLHGKAFTIAFIGIFEDWVKNDRLKDTVDSLLKFGIENNYISSDYKRTDVNCSQGEIAYVLDMIEDRLEGKRSIYESPYV